jgi:hypothetical protein
MVAVKKAPATSSSKRAIRDDGTCYYLVSYLYNVRTGEVVAILNVLFEGCDSSSADDGGGGGGGGAPTPAPIPTGWRLGCNSSTNSFTNEKNTALSATAPQMGASMQSGQESVTFIARNDASGQYAVLPGANYALNQNGEVILGPPPVAPDGWTIVAFTHTHPVNYISTGNPTGIDSLAAGADPYISDAAHNYPQYTNTLFSVVDLEYANDYGIDAFVEVYAAANNAMAQGGTATYGWGSWISGGTVGQTTNYSSGSIGAESTWAQR